MGKYKALGAFFDRVFRNDLNANFDEVDTDIKVQKARVDNLITGNPQPEEVMDLRTDTEGVIHGTAWDRFASDDAKKTTKFQAIDEQLAETIRYEKLEGLSTNEFQDAIQNAYLANKPVLMPIGATSYLICNPSVGDNLQDMVRWIRTCAVPDDSTLYIQIADGVHTVSTYLDVIGKGGILDIRASATPDEIAITNVSYSLVSGSTWRATISLASALQSRVTVGCPIGIQNLRGDNDAAAVNGGQIVKSIASDRLSFTCDFYSPKALTNPTVLDNTTVWTLPANKCIIPKAMIIAQSTGWDGSAREGFLNLFNGAKATMYYLGLAYSGAAGTEHDLIFVRDTGSRFYAFDKCVFAGAGDKVFRQYGDSEVYLNRSCVGGAGLAKELLQLTAGGNAQLVRSSFGGASIAGLTAGTGGYINFSQAPLVSTPAAVRTNGAGASAAVYPAKLSNHTRGIYAINGTIQTDNTLELERNTTGIEWQSNGFVTGAPTMGAGTQTNTSDSIATPNTLFRGGGWYKNNIANLIDQGYSLSLANNTAKTAVLTGSGGSIKAVSSSDARCGFEIDIDIIAPFSIYEVRYMGSAVMGGNGAIASPLNSTKVTVSVWQDTDGSYKIRILNETGGTRAFRLYAFGDIVFSDFS